MKINWKFTAEEADTGLEDDLLVVLVSGILFFGEVTYNQDRYTS